MESAKGVIAHSRLGASSAKRWLNCPGSVALCAKVPYQESSIYSREGTSAHKLAELCLRGHKDPKEFIGVAVEGIEVTEEMANHVKLYVDLVFQIARGRGRLLSVEERVHLKFIDESMFGTGDTIIREHYGTLFVIDFKYGAGVSVEVEENEQLLYYALGALGEDEFSEVELIVVQPRAEHRDGPIRRWKTTPERVQNFGQVLLKGVQNVRKNPDHYAIGEHCQFCNAKAICPTQKAMAREILQSDFEIEKTQDVLELTSAQIVRIIENKNMLKSYLDRVEEHATAMLMSGHKIPGLKLVAGRGARSWANEKEFKLKFGDKAYKKDLLSVAQAEKAFGKDAVKDLIVATQGRPIAASENDKRKAYNNGAIADFMED